MVTLSSCSNTRLRRSRPPPGAIPAITADAAPARERPSAPSWAGRHQPGLPPLRGVRPRRAPPGRRAGRGRPLAVAGAAQHDRPGRRRRPVHPGQRPARRPGRVRVTARRVARSAEADGAAGTRSGIDPATRQPLPDSLPANPDLAIYKIVAHPHRPAGSNTLSVPPSRVVVTIADAKEAIRVLGM